VSENRTMFETERLALRRLELEAIRVRAMGHAPQEDGRVDRSLRPPAVAGRREGGGRAHPATADEHPVGFTFERDVTMDGERPPMYSLRADGRTR
jgi:hypothetical protein